MKSFRNSDNFICDLTNTNPVILKCSDIIADVVGDIYRKSVVGFVQAEPHPVSISRRSLGMYNAYI